MNQYSSNFIKLLNCLHLGLSPWGLCVSLTLIAMLAGDSCPWQVQPCQIGRGVETRKEQPLGLQSGVWVMGQSPIPVKQHWITETSSTLNQSSFGAAVRPCSSEQSMMHLGPTTEPLVTPRTQLKIGNWCVKAMYNSGKSA